MKRLCFLFLAFVAVPCMSHAAPNDKVGHWQLTITQLTISDTAHLPNPQLWWQFGDQDSNNPGYADYLVTVSDHVIDHVDSSQDGCIAQVASSNGCQFIDYFQVTKIDDHTFRVYAKNHGGRGGIPLDIWERDYVN